MSVVQLPYPPSANTLWRHVVIKRRVATILSAEYRAWKKLAAGVIAEQRPARLVGPYRLTIVATRPDRRRRDLDNLIKPISDALKAAQLIVDDHLAASILVTWSTASPDPAAGVRVQLDPA